MENNSNSKITISISPEEKEKIRNYCKEKDLTISQFLRLVAKQYLNKEN